MLLVTVLSIFALVGVGIAQQTVLQQTCTADKNYVEIGSNPNVIIGGLYEMRRPGTDGYGCEEPLTDAMIMYEASKFAISKLNDQNYITGVRFGMRVYDTCNQVSVTLKALEGMYPQSTSSEQNCNAGSSVFLGSIGPMSGRTAIPAATLASSSATLVLPKASSSYRYANNKQTFLSTSPSSSAFAKVVASLLTYMGWESGILVVYRDNEYGRNTYKHILETAHQHGICITQVVVLDDDITSKDAVKTAISSAIGQKSFIAGVGIGAHYENEMLLEAVYEISNLRSTQWIVNDLDITSPSSLSSLLAARGVMVVAPTSESTDDFKNYFLQQERNLNPRSDNPWFLDWYEAKYKCRINAPLNGLPRCTPRNDNTFIQSPSFVPIMYAVAAYVEAVRITCQRQPTADCVTYMMNSASEETFHDTLKNLKVTFPNTYPITVLRGRTLSFDANGDIIMDQFTIYNYIQSAKFETVGAYMNGNLAMSRYPTLYNSARSQVLTTGPVSRCTSACINCLRPVIPVPLRYTPGDLVIGSLVNGHLADKIPYMCGQGVPSRLLALVAVEWAAMTYKQRNPTKLKEVTLGMLTADVCPDNQVAGALLADLFDAKKLTSPSGALIGASNIYGFVDQTDGGDTISSVLSRKMIPEIQTETVTPATASSTMHPYLIQAVPNDDVLHNAIASLFLRLGWKYIQVVTHGSGRYHDATEAFMMTVGKRGICVVNVVNVLGSKSNSRFDDAQSELVSHSATPVVVVIADFDEFKGLIGAIDAQGNSDKLQIVAGTKAWDSTMQTQLRPPGAKPLVVVSFEETSDNDFQSYLRNLNRDEIAAHPFLREVFEMTYSCYLEPSSQAIYSRACVPSQAFDAGSLQELLDSNIPYVIRSVYTMADKLHEVIAELCGGPNYSGLCSEFRSSLNISALLADKLWKSDKSNGFGIKNGKSTTDLIFSTYKDSIFTELAVYDTENMRLNRLTSNLPGTTSCAGVCRECQYMWRLQNVEYIPGDFMIGGIFGVKEAGPEKYQPYGCSDQLTDNGPQYTAAMMYALSQVKQGKAPVSLKGMTLGGLFLDHCNTPNRAELQLSDVYSNLLHMDGINYNNILAWMTDTTRSTQDVAPLLDSLDIAMVSPSATNNDLKEYRNFYRTIQGDTTVASAIIKMIEGLGFSYFQVVYSNSAVSTAGMETLKLIGQSEGVCLTKDFKMTSNAADAADRTVASLESGDTHVVVLYTNLEDTNAIMQAVKRSQSAKDGLFFLMHKPFDSILAGIDLKYPAMSIRQESAVLESYNNYINGMHAMSNPYLAQYYMKIMNCNLPGYSTYNNPCNEPLVNLTSAGSYAQDEYILATINAVYATVDALDETIKHYCGGDYTQPCDAFLSAPDQRKRFTANLANVNFIDEAGNNFKFLDHEGNMAFEILKSNNAGFYDKVSRFSGVALDLDSVVSTYSDVKSECPSPCQSCSFQTFDFSFTPGDVYLTGVFDIHETSTTPFECGDVKSLHGFLLLEAFHYALEQVNSNAGQFANILPGVRLGGIGIDACDSKIRGGQIVSNINNGYFTVQRDGHVVLPSMIDAYIGSYGSPESIYLAEILNDLEIPQISFASGSPDLDDGRYYPFFYRTVPSDTNMVKAILSFLDKMDIRYVQIVFEETANGIATKEYFVKMAPSYGVCIAQTVNYPDIPEAATTVVSELMEKPKANTVVTLLATRTINLMLQAVSLSSRAKGRLRFIGSDEWADNREVISFAGQGEGQQAINSVTVKLDTYDVKGFEDHINARTPSNTLDNPWFAEYYQLIHECYLQKNKKMGYSRQCSNNPSDTTTQPKYQQDQGVIHVMNAVYAAAYALHETIEDKCGSGYTSLCQAYKTSDDKRHLVRDKLNDVNFTDPLGSNFKFINRTGNYGYRYYSIDEGFRGLATYNQIGRFDMSTEIVSLESTYRNDINSDCQRKGACAECPSIRDNSLRYVVYERSASLPKNAQTIVGFFDIHEQGVDPYRCGEINPEGYLQFLAFIYTAKNVLESKINDIRVVAVDTCSNSLRVDQDLYGLLAGDGLCNTRSNFDETIALDNLGAVITPGHLNTMSASRLLETAGVTYISPNVLSSVFDNHQHLVRTISPDSAALKALLSLFNDMGWQFVDVIYSNDDDNYQMHELLSSTDEGICFGRRLDVDDDDSPREIDSQLEDLSGSGSKVVIVIGSHSATQRILQAAQRLGISQQYLWVLWGRWEVTEENVQKLGVGSDVHLLTVSRKTYPVPSFTKHVNEMTRQNIDSTMRPWFDEVFQKMYNCTIPTSEKPLGGRRPNCDTSKSLDASGLTPDGFVINTVAAMYAAGAGLNSAISGSNSVTKENIRAQILDVEWQMNFASNNLNTKLTFDKPNRWWDQGHLFTYWGNKASGNKKMYELGELEDLRNALQDFKDSKCMESVSEGFCGCPITSAVQSPMAQVQDDRYSPSDHRNFYKYSDSGNRKFKWPIWTFPVSILTCLGLVATVILFLILIISYPVRGGTSVLGYMVIFGIFCIYAINFAFFLHATDAVCGIRRFAMGVVYMITLAPLLVKAVDNWRYSHVDYAKGRYSGISSACSLLLMAVGLVLIQCIIPIMWLILEHPTASQYLYTDRRHDNWWCDPPQDYDLGLVLSFSFVLFVIIITSGFSALAFDSGRNSYESRWIMFCCICTAGCFLVWMVVSTNAGPPYRDPAVAIANFINATLLLICMPLRKTILMCSANDNNEKGDIVIINRNDNGAPYAINGMYDNPTYELNGFDNTFMDSKSEEF